MDERVKKFFKKYFYFLRTPHLVAKKFIKKLKKFLSEYFNARDEYDRLKDEKDNLLQALNINSLITAIEDETAALAEMTLTFADDAELAGANSDSFLDMLEEILDDQEKYVWLEALSYE